MSEYILKNFISGNINALSPDISTGNPVHFVVGFREDDGSEVRLDEKDFDRISADSNETVFSGRKRFQTLKIRIFRQSNENTLSIRAEVSGVPEYLILEYIEPLNTIINSSGNSLLLALNEGVLIDLEKGNPVSATPGWHYHSFYPGQTQAQFMAVINNSGCGVYIGAHDKSQSTKCFECTPGENGTYILSVRYYCGDNRTDGIYTIPDELVFNSFNGDWMDAAAIYRCWMEQNIEMPPKYDFPDFIKESPVILIHPVQGQGKDRAQMTENEYFPYKNAMPVIKNMPILSTAESCHFSCTGKELLHGLHLMYGLRSAAKKYSPNTVICFMPQDIPSEFTVQALPGHNSAPSISPTHAKNSLNVNILPEK